MLRSAPEVGRAVQARATVVVVPVAMLVVVAALVLHPAPASAIGGTPSVSVDPSTELADGQVVAVAVTDFPANRTIGVVECPATATTRNDCGVGTGISAQTDANGALDLEYTVQRVIFTNTLGVIDCAQTACVIAAGTLNESVVATAAVEFIDSPLPPPPFSVTFEDPHFLDRPGTSGLATLRARLTCDVTASVAVRFGISQTNSEGGTTTANSSFTYPCTPGVDIQVFSDYLAAFSPGDAQALVVVSAGGDVAGEVEMVALQPWEETIAALNLALAGPGGDQVRAELIDAIHWRVTYNPQFRSDFIRAILQG